MFRLYLDSNDSRRTYYKGLQVFEFLVFDRPVMHHRFSSRPIQFGCSTVLAIIATILFTDLAQVMIVL